METTLKQRILGIIVLVALLGFCLTVLLRGNKNAQPHVAQINTHPPITQTTTAMLGNEAPTTTTSPTNTTSTPPSITTTAPTPTSTPITPTTTTPTSSTSTTEQSTAPTPTTISKVPSVVATPATTSTVTSAPTTTPVQTISPAPVPTATQANTNTISAPEPTPVVSKPKAVVTHKKTHHPVSPSTTTTTTSVEKNLVVQVGTFSLPANAETLVDKLHEKGFTASMQKMNTSKGQMTRVIVGKKGLTRAQAEVVRQKLQKSLQLKGFIVSHEPAATPTKKVSSKPTAKTASSAPATIEDSEN